jgi:hypothetical protein
MVPRWIPATDNNPARRPWATLLVTMYVTAGPGTASNNRVAPEKMSSDVPFGTTRSYQRILDCSPTYDVESNM